MKEKTALFAGISIGVVSAVITGIIVKILAYPVVTRALITGVVAGVITAVTLLILGKKIERLKGEIKQKKESWLNRYWGRTVIAFVAGIIAIISFILLIWFFSWLLFALLGISSFICLLICMDYMTYDARKGMKDKYEQLLKEKKGEEIQKEKGKQEEERKYELFREYLKTLPVADRIAIIHPEPVGVFDHHEIRRSLTISLTIVYFALLSLSVFKSDLLIKANPLVELFTWVYLAVISFYFGSRVLEKYAEVRIGKEVEEIGEIKKKVDDIKEDLKKLKGKKTEQISETLKKIAKTKAFKDKPGEILDFLTGLEMGMEKASSIKKFLKDIVGEEIWKKLFGEPPEKEEKVSQNDIDRLPPKG